MIKGDIDEYLRLRVRERGLKMLILFDKNLSREVRDECSFFISEKDLTSDERQLFEFERGSERLQVDRSRGDEEVRYFFKLQTNIEGVEFDGGDRESDGG